MIGNDEKFVVGVGPETVNDDNFRIRVGNVYPTMLRCKWWPSPLYVVTLD